MYKLDAGGDEQKKLILAGDGFCFGLAVGQKYAYLAILNSVRKVDIETGSKINGETLTWKNLGLALDGHETVYLITDTGDVIKITDVKIGGQVLVANGFTGGSDVASDGAYLYVAQTSGTLSRFLVAPQFLPPVVKEPHDGAKTDLRQPIRGTVQAGVDKVTVTDNGTPIGTAQLNGTSWTFRPDPQWTAGEHTIRIVAHTGTQSLGRANVRFTAEDPAGKDETALTIAQRGQTRALPGRTGELVLELTAPADTKVSPGRIDQTFTAPTGFTFTPTPRYAYPTTHGDLAFRLDNGNRTLVVTGDPHLNTGADDKSPLVYTLPVKADASAPPGTHTDGKAVVGRHPALPVTATVLDPAAQVTTLVLTAGDGGKAAAGQTFPTLRVTARDAAGEPVPGVVVHFAVTGTGDSAFPDGRTCDATTGPDGVATAPALTAGKTAAPFTVQVTTPGGTASNTFHLEVTGAHKPVNSIGSVGGDHFSARRNTDFADPLTVVARDKDGNAVQGATIRFTIQDTGTTRPTFKGGVSSCDGVTDAQGKATAAPLAAGPEAGGFSVRVTALTGSGVATFTMTVTA
ncbi:hypothetical protein [Embleya sp. NPDC005971]|uniref:hypothetical protein n=1 Tax=Embleya sp. NPDC005971 TaxID=3156724 RepID=UPI0033FC29DE